MELFSIIVWTLVVLFFFVMVIVIIKGGNSWVYVFDEFNGVTKIRGKVKAEQVSFKYNTSTKGGVAIEGNTYKQGKKKAFIYRDINGILLPVKDSKIDEKSSSLELSTSQEKLYETNAIINVTKKIDNTWWGQIKAMVVAGIIIFGAVLISIVAIQKALDVEPIPEPQLLVWNQTSHAMMDLVESNQKLVDQIASDQIKNQREEIPK